MASETVNTTGPIGTLTFLFTDIEGSTARWETAGDAIGQALARHDTILRSAIERHGGTVFKTVGDAFCAVFGDASAALGAGVEVQRELQIQRWLPGCDISVRMAIHSGDSEERDGDYFGPTLNRVARLLSVAHGGQIVLSGATSELVQDRLLADVRLKDLGEHRLRDLSRPEHVYQVLAPELRSEFPALRSLQGHPNNLPSQVTSFVGREAELGQAEELLRRRDSRLVTLTGAGGTGKTRLAIEAGRDLLESFRDGVFFVPLASVTDPELIPPSIAGALGVDVHGEQRGAEAVKSFLGEREILLILDNLEQLESAAPALADLLASCLRLKLLVTSRELLHVYGEHVIVVSPMAMPDADAAAPVDLLQTFDAIALFVERARAAKSDFALTAENARDVVEICRRLDGLPLAIELAAARVRLFAPHALLPRLSDRLKLLTGGARDLPTRQQTLRGAVDWSYALLSPEEKELFASLSVFAGGCTLDAAEVVCGRGVQDIMTGLASLVDKSLLRSEDDPDGEPRFGMLESIREYAAERLAELDGADQIRSDHAAYYAGLELWDEMGTGGPARPEQIVRLDREQPNLMAAWEWLRRHDPAGSLVLGRSLARYWGLRGRWGDVIRWSEDLQANGNLLSASERASAFDIAGLVVETYGDHERAALLYDQSYTLRRESGDPTAATESLAFRAWKATTEGDAGLARRLFDEGFAAVSDGGSSLGTEEALKWLSATAQRLGLYEAAEQLARSGLAMARRRGNSHDVAARLGDLGDIALKTGDVTGAAPLFEESLELRRALNDLNCIPHSLEGLARIALEQRDAAKARALLDERLEIARKTGSPAQLARALDLMGQGALSGEDNGEAGELFRQSLPLAEQVGESATVADTLWGLAAVATAEGAPERAMRLAGAASALQRMTGETVPPIDEARNERYVAAAKEELDHDSRETLMEEGRAMSRERAVAYALRSD
jgi:predicted ATPase/class 3 adenylate cyclase